MYFKIFIRLTIKNLFRKDGDNPLKFAIIDGDKNGIERLRAIPVSTKEQELNKRTEYIWGPKK